MKLKLSLGRKIGLGFAMGLPIVLLIGAVSIVSTLEFRDSARIVAQSHRIMTGLARLLGDVASAESEARGFVVTGDERYLALYRKAIDDADMDLRDIRGRVMSAEIGSHLAQLEELLRLRLDRLNAAVETRREEGFEAALAITGPGKQIMDQFREKVSKIYRMENTLLEDRDRRSQAQGRTAIHAVLLCSLLAALLATIGPPIVTREVARRERLEREVLEVCEREPRRIGQDLHDGVCQHLTGVALLARSLHQALAGRADAATPMADRIARLIGEGIDQVRRVSHGLHPVADEPAGLMLALEELAAGLRETGAIEGVFDCPVAVSLDDQGAATHLYRIAQEAVQNAVRHARATTVAIHLASDAAALTMRVSDDGSGIPAGTFHGGLGMEIMNHRARAIGATLTIEPGAAGGTVVTCRFPRTARA